jgi:hypothetical protein
MKIIYTRDHYETGRLQSSAYCLIKVGNLLKRSAWLLPVPSRNFASRRVSLVACFKLVNCLLVCNKNLSCCLLQADTLSYFAFPKQVYVLQEESHLLPASSKYFVCEKSFFVDCSKQVHVLQDECSLLPASSRYFARRASFAACLKQSFAGCSLHASFFPGLHLKP